MGCPYHYHYHGPPPTPKETIQGVGCFIIFVVLVVFLSSFSFAEKSGFLFLLVVVGSGFFAYYLFFMLPEKIKDQIEDFQIKANISEEGKKQALSIDQKRKDWINDLRLKWESDMKKIKYWSDMPRRMREGRTKSLLKEAEKYYIVLGEEKADLKWGDYPEQEANMKHFAKKIH